MLTPAQALRDLDQVVVPDDVAQLVARGLPLDRVPLGVTGEGPWGLVDEAAPAAGGLRGHRDRPDPTGRRPGRGRMTAERAPVGATVSHRAPQWHAVTFHGDGRS